MAKKEQSKCDMIDKCVMRRLLDVDQICVYSLDTIQGEAEEKVAYKL